MPEDYPPAARALIGAGVSAREVADQARGFVGSLGDEVPYAERIRAARLLRLLALEVVERTAIAALLDGETVEDVAAALNLPAETVRGRYAPAVEAWSRPQQAEQRAPGAAGDLDVVGTAASLDQWWARHQEVGDPLAAGVLDPASRVLDRP